jgi:uncharacterized protein (DUF1015 family)
MARIYPFRALRYNPSLVSLQDVVTQPYDKITPAMQQAYYDRSPYNLVRIILGLPELFDGDGSQDLYRRASRDFAKWRRDGILTQEGEPCVFAYSQTFPVPGAATDAKVLCERRGFIALGELYDYAAKVVFRHEQTLSRPKSDRLNLLNATRAHFGQIFMLYSDPGMSAERLLLDSTAAPDIEVTDEYEVVHRVWRVSDPATINLLTTALEDKKLIIADGHHRYETALQYAREHAPGESGIPEERNPGSAPQPPYPEAAAMMTFVNMDREGLVILPTHRVVHGLADFAPSSMIERLWPYFSVEPLMMEDPDALIARLRQKQGKTAFIAITSSGKYLLTAIPEAVKAALEGISGLKISARQSNLDTVQLHAVVLEKILGISPEAIRQQTNVRYLRDAAEAIDQVARNEANVAFLMNPVTLDELREVAFAGEVMPQKSTDFFPKLLSGLTIYALD